MSNESLNDKAVSALALIKDVEREMVGVNDYGEITGFCDEQDQVVNDFHAALGSLRARASRLKVRLRKHHEAKANTTLSHAGTSAHKQDGATTGVDSGNS